MSNKSLILNKIKKYYEFSTDADFAKFLGISPSTLSNWHKRDTIDYELVFSKCEHIDGNWLLGGEGSMFRKSPDEQHHVAVIGYTGRAEDVPAVVKERDDLKNKVIELQGKVIDLQTELANKSRGVSNL